MRVWRRVRRWIAENVIEQAQPGAQSPRRRLEHMFVRVGEASDGTGERVEPSLSASLRSSRHVGERKEGEALSLVRTRSTTTEVNSIVPAWPPRSGVLIPAAMVSSTAS